jgi:hypothetical protein
VSCLTLGCPSLSRDISPLHASIGKSSQVSDRNSAIRCRTVRIHFRPLAGRLDYRAMTLVDTFRTLCEVDPSNSLVFLNSYTLSTVRSSLDFIINHENRVLFSTWAQVSETQQSMKKIIRRLLLVQRTMVVSSLCQTASSKFHNDIYDTSTKARFLTAASLSTSTLSTSSILAIPLSVTLSSTNLTAA